MMGGQKLNKMSVYDLKAKEQMFLNLYKQQEAKEKYELLPKAVKLKLIGGKKWKMILK